MLTGNGASRGGVASGGLTGAVAGGGRGFFSILVFLINI
jgi:hypothetical protein